MVQLLHWLTQKHENLNMNMVFKGNVKMLGTVVQICNPSSGEAEMEGPLELSGEPVRLSSDPQIKERPSQRRQEAFLRIALKIDLWSAHVHMCIPIHMNTCTYRSTYFKYIFMFNYSI